jgi:hypothetical protein
MKDVGLSSVGFLDRGLFTQLAVVSFLIHGQPNCFSPIVTYSQSTPIAHTGPGEMLESFCKVELGNPIRRLTLAELADFRIDEHAERVRERHGFRKVDAWSGTSWLLDVATLFIASSLARYDVRGWRSIIDGRENCFGLFFERAFERWRRYGLRLVARAMEDPEQWVNRPISVLEKSPYERGA